MRAKASIWWARPAIAAAMFLSASAPAAAAIGDWVAGDHARVRLVAAGVDAGGNLAGGIEIELESGWHTYWRSPGDAGMPPSIDFAGSLNIGPPFVSYPAPRRLDDGYAVSNVYMDRVLLPFTAKADNASRAIELVLKLDLGVCAEVCVPAHFEARLTVPPTETDLKASKLIAAAVKTVPRESDDASFAVEGAARAGGTDKRPVFEITAKVPDAKSALMFVEGPSDWYGGAAVFQSEAAGLASWRVEFDRLSAKGPIAGSALRVTVVSSAGAIEQTSSLD
jgi:DsbC/DsbD-like thiol-disulfide interchange protein